jgi:hypothetical protein
MMPKALSLQIHRLPFKAMGSACEVVLASHTQNEAESMAKLAIDEVLRIERKYSRYTNVTMKPGLCFSLLPSFLIKAMACLTSPLGCLERFGIFKNLKCHPLQI